MSKGVYCVVSWFLSSKQRNVRRKSEICIFMIVQCCTLILEEEKSAEKRGGVDWSGMKSSGVDWSRLKWNGGAQSAP